MVFLMKVITEVNTDNIRQVIDTLENYSKYYLNKKEVFDISNYQTDNYDDISAFNGLLKKIKSNYNDCGLMIFDTKAQDTHAGGSGCACCGSVFSGFLFKQLKE